MVPHWRITTLSLHSYTLTQPQRDPILLFWHTFSTKSARIGGWRPQQGNPEIMDPPIGCFVRVQIRGVLFHFKMAPPPSFSIRRRIDVMINTNMTFLCLSSSTSYSITVKINFHAMSIEKVFRRITDF